MQRVDVIVAERERVANRNTTALVIFTYGGTAAIYLALGITGDGQREVLGLWIADNEGAKFWLSVMNELRNRGVQDILIACVDGLTGSPDAIETMYPKAKVQLCIVHMIRNSLKYVSWKQRKEIVQDLKAIYTAPTAEAAVLALDEFWSMGKYHFAPLG